MRRGRLDGKIALITGGTSSIDTATAMLFVAAGRRQEKVDEAAKRFGWPSIQPIFHRTIRSHVMSESAPQYPPVPPDDLQRIVTVAELDEDQALPHIGLVGDTYTITVSGANTNGRFCVVDMHIPPDGGPGPHRHDFEETFILLEGELEFTCRGQSLIRRAGDTVNIPSNAPHQFHNASSDPARLLCICSPAGQEEFFSQVGVPVATRTTPPPKLDKAQQEEFLAKAKALAPKYRTELLEKA